MKAIFLTIGEKTKAGECRAQIALTQEEVDTSVRGKDGMTSKIRVEEESVGLLHAMHQSDRAEIFRILEDLAARIAANDGNGEKAIKPCPLIYCTFRVGAGNVQMARKEKLHDWESFQFLEPSMLGYGARGTREKNSGERIVELYTIGDAAVPGGAFDRFYRLSLTKSLIYELFSKVTERAKWIRDKREEEANEMAFHTSIA